MQGLVSEHCKAQLHAQPGPAVVFLSKTFSTPFCFIVKNILHQILGVLDADCDLASVLSTFSSLVCVLCNVRIRWQSLFVSIFAHIVTTLEHLVYSLNFVLYWLKYKLLQLIKYLTCWHRLRHFHSHKGEGRNWRKPLVTRPCHQICPWPSEFVTLYKE